MSSLQALSGFKLEIHFVQNIKDYTHLTNSLTRDLALASMVRDDLPASSMASSMAAVLLAVRRPAAMRSKVGSEF